MKGNISKIRAGEFSKDKYKGKKVPTLISLKNSNSLNKFKISTNVSVIEKTKKKDFKKILIINLI